jgi:hypothetical protein
VHKTLETAGFVLAVLGAAGVVDHFWSDFPLFDVVNGLLLPLLGLADHQLLVDVTVLLAGAVLVVLGAVQGSSDQAPVE